MYVLFTVAGKLTTYYWFKDMDDYHVIPGSYNRALSDSLQKVLFRTRIKISEVKAMVYDSVQGSRYHYIECRLKLEENYLTDDDTEKEMRRIILTKIFEMFPPDLYTGKIKVEYKGFLHSKVAMFPVDSNQLKYNF
jgi:hypothetical protein